jgi:hypothetical protein
VPLPARRSEKALARQIEQLLRRRHDDRAARLHHLRRSIDIRRRVLNVLGINLQIIERRGPLRSPERGRDRRSIEVNVQNVIFRLLRWDQIVRRHRAELYEARKRRLRNARSEASLRDARDRNTPVGRASRRNAAPRRRVVGVRRKRAGASLRQRGNREGGVELRPSEDLSRGRGHLCRALRKLFHPQDAQVRVIHARGFHPARLRGLRVCSADRRLHEVRENRRLRRAIQVRTDGAVRRKRRGDRYRRAREIRKSVAGCSHQRYPAEDLTEHIDRVIPFIDERLVRFLVRSLPRIVECQQLNPHIARRDRVPN